MPYASKEELYALVWQQGDFCNLSGVKGDWKANSLTKLAIDEIVPRNPADDNDNVKVKGGDYTLTYITSR